MPNEPQKNGTTATQEPEKSYESAEDMAKRVVRQMTQRPASDIAAEAAENAREQTERLERAGVGKRHIKASFETWKCEGLQQQRVLEACKAYAVAGPARGDGLLCLGPSGTGKTHMLVSVLRACVEQRLAIRYLPGEEFFLGLRTAIQQGREAEYISELASPQVLALDDLYAITDDRDGAGYQYRTQWLLLDRRWRSCKATITATNRTLDEFRKVFDERTRNRFEATVVVFGGVE